MKVLASILIAAGALFTASGSAGASLPEGAVLDLSSSTVAAGTSYQANFLRCESGETVTFVTENVDMEPVTATCGGVEPGASATLTAPTLDGSYTITATGSTSGESASATLTVTGGEGILRYPRYGFVQRSNRPDRRRAGRIRRHARLRRRRAASTQGEHDLTRSSRQQIAAVLAELPGTVGELSMALNRLHKIVG